ncbi:uncharacterized protein [Arachis hypogaea]|uniref:uncharacterized protein n=1 Tax=Arachis hypogaea TaxID=3818 RepID=UPI003B227370
MSSSETVEKYFTRVIDLVNKMRVCGEDMPDRKVVEKILHTMSMKYDHVVTTILESHDMDTMKIAELQETMESHISRILEKSEKSTEEALKSRVNLNNVVESSHDSVKLLLKFGNITKIPIKEKWHIPIRLKDGSLSYISNVFYAPQLDYNLLSIRQLSEKGYKMITYRGYCTVFDNNGRFIDKSKMTSNRMFPLKIQHVNPSCMSSVILDENWL